MALAERESCFQADAENGACKGLMQVNAKTHSQRFEDAGWSSSDWSDSYKNMYVAASYLSDLFDKYEDVGIVLGVYHGESKAVEKGMSGNLSTYTTKILERSEELERIHQK
jgi:soluble lytic murein transglycosylase-like protein